MAAITFNSQSISIVYGGKLISGYADGDFIRCALNEDAVMLTVGTDGVGTRSFSRNYSGTIEITLMASSPSNDYLSAVYLADQQSATGALPFLLRDASGGTLVTAETAWVKKQVDIAFSRQITQRVWTLESDLLVITAYQAGTASRVA